MNKVCNMSAPGDALAKVEGQLSRRAQESESASISCGTSLALPRLHGHHTTSFTKEKESDIDALPNEAPEWRPGVIGFLGLVVQDDAEQRVVDLEPIRVVDEPHR